MRGQKTWEKAKRAATCSSTPCWGFLTRNSHPFRDLYTTETDDADQFASNMPKINVLDSIFRSVKSVQNVRSSFFPLFSHLHCQLDELKYWELYPQQVKKWVMFTKTQQGYYDEKGMWVVSEDPNRAFETRHVDTADVRFIHRSE